MKLAKYKPKTVGDSYNSVEVINNRGTKKLIQLLEYKVSLDGETKTLGEVMEYIHENGIVYTDTKVKELEQKILDLDFRFNMIDMVYGDINYVGKCCNN